jgi:vacuolar-type H+-ATPase subunit B/Vma2
MKGHEAGEELQRRLEAQPELKARVERLLDLVENREGTVIRAADAEERTIQEIRALGQEVLQGWAERQMEEASGREAHLGHERTKKNGCIGTAVSGKSK